tara:strand:- start:1219 stop:1494 length:276 start_codon:yes stop_codon:yes gene_type:complete
MKVIIYVQPQDVSGMNKWLSCNIPELELPSYWLEPLKSVKTRQSLVQVIISTDDLQKLLDAAATESEPSAFTKFAQAVGDFENPKQTKLDL